MQIFGGDGPEGAFSHKSRAALARTDLQKLTQTGEQFLRPEESRVHQVIRVIPVKSMIIIN